MTTFRARARALEMLGRQQIRGPGTALSELFKNAHDAYATEVRADLFRDRNALAIRDDGVGMSESEFVERWLTIGTESRLDVTGSAPGANAPKGFQPRAMLGEKGIGRLAIAALGSQVLVLTRRRGRGQALVGSFVNWDLFAIPGLDLEEIEIPLTTFPSPGEPSAEELEGLLESAVQSVTNLRVDEDLKNGFVAAIRGFPIELVGKLNRLAGPRVDSAGTQFLIAPIEGSLLEDLEAAEGEEISDLEQDLIGFANTLAGTPVLDATFHDHREPGDDREIIGRGEFWTPDDLRDADHEVQGSFDDSGTFRGRVRVYDREVEHRHVRRGGPAPLRAGPFSLHFGYLQGRLVQSRADPDRYAQLQAKADKIAGLYVYRDGIRIQPYGDHKFDWLSMERNRTKSASYYFFSYRRIFGYVALDREHNWQLSEKAGREGFRETSAYREFRNLLQDLFLNLAASFFRTGGEEAEYFLRRREELERADLAKREREKQVKAQRTAFGKNLARAREGFRRGVPQAEIAAAIERHRTQMSATTTEGGGRE